MDPYAPPDGPGILDRVRRTLGASAAEVAGLAVLSLGAALATGLVWWSSLPGGAAAPEPPAPPVPAATPAGAERLTVHVTGAVVRPGVVELPAGSRVADAVASAGGPRADASVQALNLARELTDGEQVTVPSTSEGGGDPHPPASPSAWRPDGRLDLNAATGPDLEQLPGIGPVLAQRILDWRDANGPFAAAEQLLDVPGIGDRTFDQLADLVTP